MHIDLLHLLLLRFLIVSNFLPIALLLHGHLLLLLEKEHLLDLLLRKLLVDHLLLCWEVILFDLLTSTFDFKLSVLVLIIIFLLYVILIHDLLILFVHLLLLGLQKHELLLLLLFFIHLLFAVVLAFSDIFFTFIIAFLLVAIQLGVNQFLQFLFRDLKCVGVLFILFLQVRDKQLSLFLV